MATQRRPPYIPGGICYGRNGYGFPTTAVFLDLCGQVNIKRLRLYEPDKPLLQSINDAPNNRGFDEVTLGVPNDLLESLCSSKGYAIAKEWVKDNVKAYDKVKFKYITVGDKVNPNNVKALGDKVNPNNVKDLEFQGANLAKAMENVKHAIDDAKLGNIIKVSTVVDAYSVLEFDRCPSKSCFKTEYVKFLRDALGLLVTWGAPLMVNVHPFIFYLNGQSPPGERNLPYAVFTSKTCVVNDNGKEYKYLFDAILDSVYWAVEKVFGGPERLNIVVSETGWPTSGTDSAAIIENAHTYNNNLLKHVPPPEGTPKKPGCSIDTYVLSMFDENGKLGTNFDKYWGIYTIPVPASPPELTKYPIDFKYPPKI